MLGEILKANPNAYDFVLLLAAICFVIGFIVTTWVIKPASWPWPLLFLGLMFVAIAGMMLT